MPELPEVQTTVDQVGKAVAGLNITDTWMDTVKSINTGSNLGWAGIRRHITGKRITTVQRRAKFIVMRLDDGSALWVHQKMTGHLLVGQWARTKGEWVSVVAGPLADDPMNRYLRVILTLSDGRQLALSDARRFARIILTRSDAEIPKVKELARLGPEPLELSAGQFISVFKGRRGLVKPTLMDPAVIVGIGNIYADEILHRANVHPFRGTHTLTDADLKSIWRHMRTILTTAIRHGGSSTDDYRTPEGNRGGYQNRHRAYQRTGMKCTVCSAGTIERAFRNGRSSHFCSSHQR